MDADVKSLNRQWALDSYNAGKSNSNRRHKQGDPKYGAEYVYGNQKTDALNVTHQFMDRGKVVVVVQKPTKIGADGFMIEVIKNMCTHPDDDKVMNIENARILTGMANVQWVEDMKEKSPECIRKNIYHRPQLKNAELSGLRDSIIIIDEIDVADKDTQQMCEMLKAAGILDINTLLSHNIKLLLISATVIKEQHEIFKWPIEHYSMYKMTIPDSYMGVDYLHRNGYVTNNYPMKTADACTRWVTEDVLSYGTDYRVHLMRSTNSSVLGETCKRHGVRFVKHNSKSGERLGLDELTKIFEGELTCHVVISLKGFWRRANLIPTRWKFRIGAIHEQWTSKPDTSVTIQALLGRMTGYGMKDALQRGHKMGPIRVCVDSVKQYISCYDDPFRGSYTCAGFVMRKGSVRRSVTTLVGGSKKAFNMDMRPSVEDERMKLEFDRGYRVFDVKGDNDKYSIAHGASRTHDTSKLLVTPDGFIKSTTSETKVFDRFSLERFMSSSTIGSNFPVPLSRLDVGKYAFRRYVCYENLNDSSTVRYATSWVKRLRSTEEVDQLMRDTIGDSSC